MRIRPWASTFPSPRLRLAFEIVGPTTTVHVLNLFCYGVFSFQQNKPYLNRPLIVEFIENQLILRLRWSWDSVFELVLPVCIFVSGSRVLFTGPTSTLFSKIFINIGSHSTIYTFKNYFITVFSIFSFSKISSIQMNPKYILFP